MKTLHRDNGAAHIKIERLKVKLKNAIDNKGVSLDREVTDDLHQVMEEEEEKAMSDVQPVHHNLKPHSLIHLTLLLAQIIHHQER